MNFLLTYFGIGIAVYCAFRLLFRKTGINRKGLNGLWWCGGGGDIIGLLSWPLFWPIWAFLSLIWWLGEILHLRSQRNDEKDTKEKLESANKYSHLSMDELLVAQKRMMNESQNRSESRE